MVDLAHQSASPDQSRQCPSRAPWQGTPLRTQTRRWYLLVLVVIVAGGGAMRLYGLDRTGLWLDEMRQTDVYKESLPQVVVKSLSIQRQTPFDYVIGWAVFKISDSDTAARLPSALFGTGTVLVLYLLLARLFSVPVGLLGALLLAFSPFHLELSQEARPYTIFIFFYALTLYALAVAWERNDWKGWLGFALAAELMLLSRAFGPVLAYASIPVAALATGLGTLAGDIRTQSLPRARLVRLAGCSVVLAVLYLPIAATLARYERERPYSRVWASPLESGVETGGFGSLLGRNLGVWRDSIKDALAPAATLKIVLALGGAALVARNWLRLSGGIQRLVLLSLLVAGLLYLLAYTAMVGPTKPKPRYFLFQVIMYCSLMALAVAWIADVVEAGLRRGLLGRRIALVVVVILLFGGGIKGYADYRQSYRRPDWRGCAQFLNEHLKDGDLVIVFTDRRFGGYQREFVGQPYLTNKQVTCDSLWRMAFAKPYGDIFAHSANKPGRAYLVLHFRIDRLLRQEEFMRAGLQTAPPGMQLRKFRRLDLLWFDGPPTSLTSDVVRLTDALLGVDEPPLIKGAPSSRARVHALRARMLMQLGNIRWAAREYAAARAAVPEDRLGYFDAKTGVMAWLRAYTKPRRM